ncbi:hypothetical protein ACI5KX_07665 [Erythrobacter sp. GH1-10]|uniref:hypothetical protein n=1 Tax=Erythrobacter sp. GH1-10 TaxID=3349334 RepID=UPI0038782B61
MHIFLALILAPILFVVAFGATKRLVLEGAIAHFFMVCIFVPFLFAAGTLWATSPEAPTEHDVELIAAGLMADPGPASFVFWAEVFGIPIVSYILMSIPLFFFARRRVFE